MSIIAIILKIWPKRWVSTALVVIAILYLTIVPRPLPDDTINIPGLDKLIHAVMFGGLAFVASIDKARRSRCSFTMPSSKAVVIIVFATILFGGAVEIAQMLTGLGRSADWIDFVADAAGVVAGAWIAIIVLRRWIRRFGNTTC